jgi:inhibitor of cysteine peptidase
MPQLDQSSHNTEVVLRVGEILEIVLPENPTTGYHWELRSGGEPACAPRDSTFEPGGTKPGQGGVRRWRFEAVRQGSGTIDLVNRRSWEKNKPPAQAYHLTVKVRK